MKKLVLIGLLALCSVLPLAAAGHFTIGVSYSYETFNAAPNDYLNYQMLGIALSGYAGKYVGFIYDFSILVPYQSTIGYPGSTYSKTPPTTASFTYSDINRLAVNGLLGVGFAPLREELMLDFGIGLAFTGNINARNISASRLSWGIGPGANLGIGIGLGDHLAIRVECQAAYYAFTSNNVVNDIMVPPAIQFTPTVGICFR